MGEKLTSKSKKVIAIIGSDSYIASRFYEAMDKSYLKLYSRRSSGKKEEIVKDLFLLSSEDFEGVDVVINFAAIVHRPEPKDDTEFREVNSELPVHLAKVAHSAGVEHFIQMSSLAVYGDVEDYTIDSPLQPVGAYGRTKLIADKVLLEMIDDTFCVSIVRPPIVYGGGLSPGNMQRLVRMTLKGIPMPFKGLNNERDFLHVYNLVAALEVIFKQQLKGVLMPTDKKPVSTEDVVNLVSVFSASKVRKITIPAFLLSLLKLIRPAMYHKLFAHALVECNMPKEYQPKYQLSDGIEDLVQAIEES